MASRCGRGRSLLSTPPWCHHCVVMGLPGHGLLTMMGPRSSSQRAHVPRTDWGRGKGSRRLGAGGVLRRPTFWQKAKAEAAPDVLRGRVQQANVRRWSALLACSAIRAFSASLLDRRPVPAPGVIPSVDEVVREARFF